MRTGRSCKRPWLTGACDWPRSPERVTQWRLKAFRWDRGNRTVAAIRHKTDGRRRNGRIATFHSAHLCQALDLGHTAEPLSRRGGWNPGPDLLMHVNAATSTPNADP